MYDITIKYNKKEKFYWASMSKNGKSAVMIFFDDGKNNTLDPDKY